jgi:hypothetical protein
MKISTTSEKIGVLLDRKKKTKTWLSKELGMSRPTLDKRMKDNFFTVHELMIIKTKLGLE